MDFNLAELNPDYQNTLIDCLSGKACTKIPLYCMKLIRDITRIGNPGPFWTLIPRQERGSGEIPKKGDSGPPCTTLRIHIRAWPVFLTVSSAIRGAFSFLCHGHR